MRARDDEKVGKKSTHAHAKASTNTATKQKSSQPATKKAIHVIANTIKNHPKAKKKKKKKKKRTNDITPCMHFYVSSS